MLLQRWGVDQQESTCHLCKASGSSTHVRSSNIIAHLLRGNRQNEKTDFINMLAFTEGTIQSTSLHYGLQIKRSLR